MAETANLADWISTLIGVGGLGKPELNPLAATLMLSFGVLGGTTLFKAMVGVELAGIAGAAVLLAERKAITGYAWSCAFLGVLALATLALCTITAYNLGMILRGAS
jgi:hypothetical protein